MRAVMAQYGLLDLLDADAESETEAVSRTEKERRQKAHSQLILCLGDKVLREVARETTVACVWLKLETLYMTRSLANRLNKKQRLYSFKILDERNSSSD